MRKLAAASVLAIAGVAAAQALPSIVADAPPMAVHADEMPMATLVIEEAGEYQIDATGGADGDAELLLLVDGVIMAEDTTTLGPDARVIAFLAPDTYGVRVRESLGRAMTASLSARRLPPLPSAATVSPGDPPATVQVAHAGSVRDASAEVTLRITALGAYRIDARSPDADHDAELQLLQGGALIQSDGDGGDGSDARIVRRLDPGEYAIRVHDYANRGGALVVEVTAE